MSFYRVAVLAALGEYPKLAAAGVPCTGVLHLGTPRGDAWVAFALSKN